MELQAVDELKRGGSKAEKPHNLAASGPLSMFAFIWRQPENHTIIIIATNHQFLKQLPTCVCAWNLHALKCQQCWGWLSWKGSYDLCEKTYFEGGLYEMTYYAGDLYEKTYYGGGLYEVIEG